MKRDRVSYNALGDIFSSDICSGVPTRSIYMTGGRRVGLTRKKRGENKAGFIGDIGSCFPMAVHFFYFSNRWSIQFQRYLALLLLLVR